MAKEPLKEHKREVCESEAKLNTQDRMSAFEFRERNNLLDEVKAKSQAVRLKKQRKQEERKLQKDIVRHFDQCKRCTHYICHHSPNGGKRDVREGAHFKQMGTRAGYPDLEFLADGQSYFIEVKWGKGRLNDNQIAMHQLLTDNAFDVVVVDNLDDAILQMREWGLI